MATIHATIENQVQNIGGIHDCFTSTPSEMSRLRDSVRQTFADLYSTDRLTQLKTTLESQISNKEDLPPGPTLGELDPTITKKSNYFIT